MCTEECVAICIVPDEERRLRAIRSLAKWIAVCLMLYISLCRCRKGSDRELETNVKAGEALDIRMRADGKTRMTAHRRFHQPDTTHLALSQIDKHCTPNRWGSGSRTERKRCQPNIQTTLNEMNTF